MLRFYTNVIQYGNRILYRGIAEGRPVQNKIEFAPTLFVKSQKKSEYKSLFGDNLEPIKFGDINDAKEYIDTYSEVDNFAIYGNTNFAYQFITEHFEGEIQFDISQMKIFSLDIETSAENGFPDVNNPLESVLLITMQDANTKHIISFGCKPITKEIKPNHEYILCRDEKDLFIKFIAYIALDYPHVITGWNCEVFDIPYLVARMRKVVGEDATRRLSPWNQIRDKSFKGKHGKETLAFDIVGISVLDYLDLYKKFTYSAQESYKLDHIAKVELGKEKLSYDEYDSFRDFYRNDWQKFVEYNVRDVELVDQLEDKMKLIELIITMAFDAKCNFNDVFSAVRIWDCTLYNHLWNKKIIVHQRDTSRKGRQIVGAFVKEPVPGKYDWVVSFDATSLYPSIIMQYNMSPETMMVGISRDTTIDGMVESKYDITEFEDHDACMAANGYFYTKEKQGLFPEIVQKLFDDRQRYKKLMIQAQKDYEATKDKKYQKEISKYNNFQMARKIQLNSLFGAWGNEYFRYYDDRIAEGITITGQFVIQRVANELNKFLNKICETENFDYSFYSDTDSCYITLDPVVQKFFKNQPKEKIIDLLDKICEEKIVKVINKACDSLFDYTNGFDKKIYFKRESICDRGIWVAKKRYALNVFDNEGVRYQEPKLKVMGLEIVKSSTPEPVRIALKEAVKIALTQTEDDLHKYISRVEEGFVNLKPEDIAFPRGVNGVIKYANNTTIYGMGTPMHVRGALLYNHYIKKNKLDKKYQTIQEGDKIKFLYLKEPNTINENCIAFISTLPEELGLTKYVDYNTMFEKSFIEPLTAILQGLGWNAKPQATLDALFA